MLCDSITIVEFSRLIKEKYSQIEELEQYASDARNGLFRWESEFISPYIRPGSSVLVFGSGAGREVLGLEKVGINAVGVELCYDQILLAQQLKKEGKGIFINADALALPFKNMNFDSALMFRQFLQHFPGKVNREKVLSEAWRVLVKGGFLFLSINLKPFSIVPTRIMNYVYRRFTEVKKIDDKKQINQYVNREKRRVCAGSIYYIFYRIILNIVGSFIFSAVDLYRSLIKLLAGKNYRGIEPGDHLISQVSSAKSKGKIWFHNYSYSEIMEELRTNGFEVLKVNDIAEIERGHSFPEIIRRGAVFIAIVARKIS